MFLNREPFEPERSQKNCRFCVWRINMLEHQTCMWIHTEACNRRVHTCFKEIDNAVVPPGLSWQDLLYFLLSVPQSVVPQQSIREESTALPLWRLAASSGRRQRVCFSSRVGRNTRYHNYVCLPNTQSYANWSCSKGLWEWMIMTGRTSSPSP